MSDLTTQHLYNSLMAGPHDPEESVVATFVRDHGEPFLRTCQELGLDNPVTLELLLQARIAFFRFCLDHGFAAVAKPPAKQSHLVNQILMTVASMEGFLAELPGSLPSGYTKASYLEERAFGHAPSVKALLAADELTLGQLLHLSPITVMGGVI